MPEEKKEQVSFQDLMPRKKFVMVGEKQLLVKEYVAAKRDAVVKMVLETAGSLSGLLEKYQTASRPDKDGVRRELTVIEMAAGLKDLIRSLLGGNLTLIACLTLDVQENREIVGIAGAHKVEDNFRYEYTEEMFSWVRGNLTMRQELELLDAVFEVNGFGELVKKYGALVTSAMNVAGAVTTAP